MMNDTVERAEQVAVEAPGIGARRLDGDPVAVYRPPVGFVAGVEQLVAATLSPLPAPRRHWWSLRA
jgi:hypothetical protein